MLDVCACAGIGHRVTNVPRVSGHVQLVARFNVERHVGRHVGRHVERHVGRQPIGPGSTTSTRATATISAGAYPAAEVCTYLSGQLPALTGVGSAVGAHANLVGNLFGFLQAHGIVPDSAALDEATSAHCPEMRQQVLAATGLTSLTQL